MSPNITACVSFLELMNHVIINNTNIFAQKFVYSYRSSFKSIQAQKNLVENARHANKN